MPIIVMISGNLNYTCTTKTFTIPTKWDSSFLKNSDQFTYINISIRFLRFWITVDILSFSNINSISTTASEKIKCLVFETNKLKCLTDLHVDKDRSTYIFPYERPRESKKRP